MTSNPIVDGGSGRLDLTAAETALAVLRKASARAVDELGGAVPADQQRALLIIDEAGGSLDLRRFATELTSSLSAAGKLCGRMEAAGLLVAGRAAEGLPEMVLSVTGSGRRLASWIRDRQRMALGRVLGSMRTQARDALMYGLSELAATAQKPD